MKEYWKHLNIFLPIQAFLAFWRKWEQLPSVTEVPPVIHCLCHEGRRAVSAGVKINYNILKESVEKTESFGTKFSFCLLCQATQIENKILGLMAEKTLEKKFTGVINCVDFKIILLLYGWCWRHKDLEAVLGENFSLWALQKILHVLFGRIHLKPSRKQVGCTFPGQGKCIYFCPI